MMRPASEAGSPACLSAVRYRSRDAEVQDLSLAARGQVHVGRLEIPVDDAAIVRFCEPVCDLESNSYRVFHGKGTVGQARRHRFAGHVLHHDNEAVRGLEHVVDGRDIRVRQARGRSSFPKHPRASFLATDRRRPQPLDRDVALQARIAGAIHLTHPATPE